MSVERDVGGAEVIETLARLPEVHGVFGNPRHTIDGNIGEVELIPDEPAMPLPDECRGMSEILSSVLDDLGRLYEPLERHMDDAGWVTSRFVEILPIDLEEKQACLESSDAAQRLELVKELLNSSR